MNNLNDLRGKRVVVTGGAGAIGGNLVRELLKYDCNIVVLDDLSSGFFENLPRDERVDFVWGSVTDDDDLRKVFSKKVDVVFHLATLFANQNSVEHPDVDLLTNGLGTLKVLQYSVNAKVERFVFTGSSCVYGDVSSSALESYKDFHLDTPYAITKLLGEYYVRFFGEHFGLPVVICRLFNSFGVGERPGRYRNVIPNFLWGAMHDEPLTIYGSGEETRDFNWVENTIQGLMLCAVKQEAVGHIFNIGGGGETRIIDVARTIFKVVGKPENIVFKPRREWDTILHRRANINKTKTVLGYNPDNSDFEGKIRLTYEWMKTIPDDEVRT